MSMFSLWGWCATICSAAYLQSNLEIVSLDKIANCRSAQETEHERDAKMLRPNAERLVMSCMLELAKLMRNAKVLNRPHGVCADNETTKPGEGSKHGSI